MSPSGHTAVLLLNVGSPKSPRPLDVALYLTQFLTDKHVLNMPWPLRQLLVRGLIVPLRFLKSAAKYKRVWTAQGAPLLLHAHNLQQGLQQRLPHMRVLSAMRYGEPSIAWAVDTLMQKPPARLLVVPMFAHHNAASSGTGLEKLKRCLARHTSAPPLHVVKPLSALHAFNQCLGQKILRHAQSFKPEYLLFSYHGLPLSHVRANCKPGCRKTCALLAVTDCMAPFSAFSSACYPACYVQQCHTTSQTLASYVEGLPTSTAFQSHMRGSAWTSPFTVDIAKTLAKKGVLRLMVACPSFACDCLETLEEVGMGIRKTFLRAGGEAFDLVPCLNDEPSWLDGLAQTLQEEGK